MGNMMDHNMRNRGNHLTIDATRQPEGYITDFSTSVNNANGQQNLDATMRIVNLPKTATVTFDIEFIDMNGSAWPHCSILAEMVNPLSNYHPVYYVMEVMESIVKQRLMKTGDNPLHLRYASRIPGEKKEYVRLKYSGIMNINHIFR
jgi:hypothetical protein